MTAFRGSSNLDLPSPFCNMRPSMLGENWVSISPPGCVSEEKRIVAIENDRVRNCRFFLVDEFFGPPTEIFRMLKKIKCANSENDGILCHSLYLRT